MPIEGYGAAAPIYQAAGWRGVLPLPPGKKWPPPDGFTGEHGVWPKPSTIEDWCRSQPDANLALRLPDGMVGPDLDLYKEGRQERYRELVRRIGPPPPTWRSSSREDGSGIYLYRVPPGTRLAGDLPLGLGETVQRHHRYICAWPSMNPDSGARVYWWDPEGNRRETAPSDLDEIPELPEEWLEALMSPEAFEPPSANGTSANGSRPDGWSPRVAEVLAEALESMTVGSRHDTATRYSFELVRYAELGHPGAEEALEQLGQVFRTSILDRSTPEEAAAEWARMVTGARSKAAAEPSSAPHYGDDGPRPEDFVGGHRNNGAGHGEEPTRRRHLRLTSASAIPVRPVRWLWEGRIPLGSYALLGGREGVGKSVCVYTLAAEVTQGRLPGAFSGTPKAVVVAATEDSWEYTIVPRLMAAGADLTRVYRVDVITETDLEVELVLPADLGQLAEKVVEVDAGLVVFDPLISRLDGRLDTHKDVDVRRALEALVRVTAATGAVGLGLIHVNKSNARDALSLLMASRAFAAVARSVLFVMQDPDHDGQRLLGQPKNNLGRSDLPTLRFQIEAAHVADTEEGPVWTAKLVWTGEVDRSIDDFLEDAASGSSVGREAEDWLVGHLEEIGGSGDSAEIKKAAMAAGHSERTIHRARERLGVAVTSTGFPRRTYWTLLTTATSSGEGAVTDG